MSLIRKAKRHNIPLKLGIRGASGSGKTYSSLQLAKGLVGDLEKVIVLDTENGSADLYSNMGNYSVLPFLPPYKPQRYADAIKYIVEQNQFDCIIIDSTSHEWDGEGGCLDIHTSLGGKFQDWAKVTPMHKAFITAILQAPVHIICTMRTKQEYAMEQNSKGRMQVAKVGTKEIQRDGFEYELTACFNVEQNHMATMSKDRTNLFNDGAPFLITEETGKKIREWNNEQ